MAGARKAALSQISGEVLVLEGLYAADAINPGRESFYEESVHYRTLKRTLIGHEDVLAGTVGQAVRLISDRGNIRGQVSDKLGSARQRRKVLTDISSAINTVAQADPLLEERLREFLDASISANGLANAKDVLLLSVGSPASSSMTRRAYEKNSRSTLGGAGSRSTSGATSGTSPFISMASTSRCASGRAGTPTRCASSTAQSGGST